jgi:threonine/homoserine/homoserine lactone efflux protein
VHTAFAVAGLSTILSQSALAFSVVKYAGTAYLFYLGVRTILEKGGCAAPERAGRTRLWVVFRQGVLSNVPNPKATLLFLALLPKFVDRSRDYRCSVSASLSPLWGWSS